MPELKDELIPTRRSLLTRLKKLDDQGWHDFFNTYWKLIYGVALKSGLSPSDAEDVVQETVVAAARQMPNFKYDESRGSFKSWLLTITRRRISDVLRKEYRRAKTSAPLAGETGRTTAMERVPDPAAVDLDAIWEHEWKRGLFHAALRKVKRKVENRHYQIFDCYALKEWPVEEVARTFGVKVSQVYLIKHRISEQVAREVKDLEARPGPSKSMG